MEIVNKYANGKIYKVTDIGYNKCYYGSTCSTLSTRMSAHKNSYSRYLTGNCRGCSVFSLFEVYGIENCKIELVKLFTTSSKIQLEAEEGLYIQNNECINKNTSGKFQKLGKKEYFKQYHIENKNKKIERITDNPQYYKDYYEKNKEKYQARNLARKKIFVHCDICDCDLSQKAYICHTRTPKHLNNILLKNI